MLHIQLLITSSSNGAFLLQGVFSTVAYKITSTLYNEIIFHSLLYAICRNYSDIKKYIVTIIFSISKAAIFFEKIHLNISNE